MTTETTIEDRIAARIARVADARDQVVKTLIRDLRNSVSEAHYHGIPPNPLENRAIAVLERLIAPGPILVADVDQATLDLLAELDHGLAGEGPVTLDDPRFAAHPIAQANAASWPKPKRSRRRPTRAEKIAASKAGR